MNKPTIAPVGATHLVQDTVGNWIWLFEEPSDGQYVVVETIPEEPPLDQEMLDALG